MALLLACLLALPLLAAPTPPADDSGAMPTPAGGAPADRPPSAVEPALPAAPAAAAAPVITLWSGPTLPAGQRGDPQKWVNVLGNVTSPVTLTSLSYTLNGGPSQPLATGPDNMRLARSGDFNVELDYTDLRPGANTVVIRAVDQNGGTAQSTVTVNYRSGDLTWLPQTYFYDWSTVTRVADLAQMVDGPWRLDGDSVRPTVFDFDRLLALGDLSWRDYTVTVPITVFGIDESGYTAPSNGPGVGVMVRWQGHYRVEGDTQPRTGWRRLGALGWYRWQRDGSQYTEGFEVLGQGGRLIGTTPKGLDFGVTYMFKLAVQSNPNPDIPATYRFKVWPAGTAEPALWDVERRGFQGEPSGGGLLLLAHHVDARFGTVRVDLLNTRPRPTLTIITDGPGGGSVRLSPSASPRIGEDVVVRAVPDIGSAFAGWSGALTGTANPGVVTLFESTTITATFSADGNGIALPMIVSSNP
ncbi:MAG: hypothetical protein KBG73_04785 [Candidatus Promineofilum sp.]|nr:hypothetical protein [Promineifilum sp.]